MKTIYPPVLFAYSTEKSQSVNRLINCFFFLLLFFSIRNSYAQNYTISGVIKEANSGETLIGTNIYIGDGNTNTVSNEYGFYSLTIPKDTIVVAFSFVGYETIIHQFYLHKDTVLNIELKDVTTIKEVVVSAASNKERLNSTQMGAEKVTAKEAKEITAMFGEVDIIKVLQLKPGVQSGIEGATGIYVRGGGVDQNHFLLDEATIYNPSHLLGIFSTFNADLVKDVTLYKAGFPAQYGGKLSSVIDVRTREGNRKKYEVKGGLGLISARLAVEGPIKKDKGAFILSARRTYADLFTNLLNKNNENNPDWTPIPSSNFYDINAKLNYDISPKDRLFFSAYLGRDAFIFRNKRINFDLQWGNIAGTLRWNRTIAPNIFVNTSLTFSDYVYDIKSKVGNIDLKLGSGIQDLSLKTDFMFLPSTQHELRFGLSAVYHKFLVGQFDADNGADIKVRAGSLFHAGEFALYWSDDWTISPKVKLLSAIRLSGFYNDRTFYPAAEPRFAIKYSVHPRIALKASYARMNQYIHLVSTSGATLPTNAWYPSNKNVAPQASDLLAASLSVALGKDFYINIEGYYKWLHGQIDFRDGAKLFINDQLDQEFIFGSGCSYGGEIYIEKKNGNLRGWIGYTLSWTWRQFDQANGGQAYHPMQDRRHDISAVITWDIPWTNPKFPLTLSASWVYGTGSAISLPSKRYIQTDITATNPFQFIPIYTERGGFQMPAYHRLDLGLVWKLFPLDNKRFKSDITFSIYNVYDRRNPFFMYIDALYTDDNRGANTAQIPEKFQGKVVSLFPIIPSITWNFKW
ncbi:TonB-dependent receptor [Aureispira anguillae]|uniref:TonB-dependent receptor n=1 Tax=Aureispira anguillae TaxID=2864201 RepID=A0A915YE33_9BACT|nr:TonB-dependent receptor [Aureispira anguillae]BDS11414.1 TonB-dependent receptor [Aureispira anguillae]